MEVNWPVALPLIANLLLVGMVWALSARVSHLEKRIEELEVLQPFDIP